jgi:hypothetical protein
MGLPVPLQQVPEELVGPAGGGGHPRPLKATAVTNTQQAQQVVATAVPPTSYTSVLGCSHQKHCRPDGVTLASGLAPGLLRAYLVNVFLPLPLSAPWPQVPGHGSCGCLSGPGPAPEGQAPCVLPMA